MKRLVCNNEKLNKYNEIIEKIMINDPNSSCDTILQESNSLDNAIATLNSSIQRILNEEPLDKDEITFYTNIKNDLSKLL